VFEDRGDESRAILTLGDVALHVDRVRRRARESFSRLDTAHELKTTWSPSFAKRSAVASPMPLVDPAPGRRARPPLSPSQSPRAGPVLTRLEHHDVLATAQRVRRTGHWFDGDRGATATPFQVVAGEDLEIREVAIDTQLDLTAGRIGKDTVASRNRHAPVR